MDFDHSFCRMGAVLSGKLYDVTYSRMSMKKDILTLADIRLLVDSFYDKVRDNALLAPIFDERIGDAWPHHLEKMYRFWETVLLDTYTYTGAPFTPHANLPVAH